MAKVKDVTIEDKLRALFKLQLIDSKIDKIKIVRGELPLEVQDLEDEIAGLETRTGKLEDEITGLEKGISDKKNMIQDALELIKKYEEQQNNVRNNREYDSLSKEIEFQTLEIELANKRIKEAQAGIESKKEVLNESKDNLNGRKGDLDSKKSELDDIIAETQKEEDDLIKNSEKAEKVIEERLITAYKRVRNNVRNGLAVVSVQRDACGGCFNKIPPQRQLDIRMRKKILVCEHCGRILVDPDLSEEVAEKM